ncbi:MAG: PepSY-associated TM helix domain-containing protein, partial [Methylomonas sp.]
NPYTAEIINKRFWGQYLITWIYDLHYTLLLDTTGKVIMAILGLLLTVSLLSGVYLWWPPLHKLKAALTIKRGSSEQRFNYDLHKVAGIYPLLMMLMLALTGIALEVPHYVNPAIDYFLPIDKPPPKPQSTPNSTLLAITADQAVATAQQLFPQTRLCWIETPDGPTGTFRINLRQDFEPSQRFPKTNVWLDQYSGNVLLINNPKQQSSGTALLSWLHPLHNGEIFGLTGQVLVLVTGFACPVLFVTGVIRWLQKRRAKQKHRRD